MQAFGIALIVAGVTLSTVVLALITNALVSRRIEQSLGQGSIRGMDGHVVLVGLGAVGLRVLEGLREQGRDVVVVEYDEGNRYVQHARSLGVPIVHGDATLGQTLRSVNIAEAGAVAILTSDDLVNLETGLAVRDSLGERWERGAGGAAGLRPRPRPAGSRGPSSSTTSGRPRPWRRPGSSAPCWDWRSWRPSTSSTSPSSSPA